MPTKKPSPLSSTTIKPYASYTLFTCDDKSFKTIQDKLTKMESLAQGAFNGKMTVQTTSGFWKEAGVLAKAFTLREDRASAWSADKSVIDTIHHLVVFLHYGGYYALVITDSAARALATNAIESSLIFQKIDDAALENAFVNDVVLRTLWLRGSHRKNNRKADSKILFGSRLQDALNPMDDRSFQSSSVRSEALPPPPGGKQRVIGVTPTSSYLWLGPTKDASDLIGYFVDIIKHLKLNGAKVTKGIPILTKPVNAEPKTGEVWEAFDFSFIEAEQASFLGTGQQLLDSWEQELEITTTGTPTDSSFRLQIHDALHPGTWGFDLRVDKWTKGFATTAAPTSGTDKWPRLHEFMTMLAKASTWSVWYESGHAVIEGKLTHSDVTIADFDGARSANFGVYDIEVEKPVKLDANGVPTKSIDYAKIGADNSLCSWWLNVGALDVFSGLRKLGANDFAIMLCDDGAGEVADFILFARHGSFATPTNPSTLAVIQVHLKAAGALNKTPTISGAPRARRMAPKQFEEVLGQAVKNLSVIRMPSLGQEFEEALLAGKNPLWELQGNQFALALPYGKKIAKGSRFLNCIKEFNGQRYHKHVIVIQPHQSLARFNLEMAAQHPSAKMRLLCTLLNSADAACRSDGAKFDTIFCP